MPSAPQNAAPPPPLPPSVTEASQGLRSLAICNRHARARIFLQGAHVAEWRPVGHEEGLWTSVRSLFEPGKPIRGGIPICFPWFGPHPTRSDLPPHGFARLLPWTLTGAEDLADGRTRVTLALRSSDETRAIWPHEFALSLSVVVGATLALELAVTNEGTTPISFEEALHTYFSVGDVRRTTVEGLAGATYVDKVDGATRKAQGPDSIAFTGETDRVHLGAEGSCAVVDAALGRRIEIGKRGSRTTVVWNPWVAKAARMPDFGDDEWPGMVCVETANAADDRIELAAGQTHELVAEIAIARPAGR